MNRAIRAYGLLMLLIILAGMEIVILVRTNTGLAPWDAMALCLSYLTGLKLGTIVTICNLLCIFGQIIILKKDFKKIDLLQIPISILLGNSINFFATVFQNLTFDNYILKISVAIFIITLLSFTIAGMVALELPTFSLMAFCSAVHIKTNIPFAKFRQWVDFACVGMIVVLTLVFPIKWSLRERTIISMIIFGPLLGISMPKIEKLYKKWDLVDGKSEIEKEIEGLK